MTTPTDPGDPWTVRVQRGGEQVVAFITAQLETKNRGLQTLLDALNPPSDDDVDPDAAA